jgi:hypothetical protein
LAIGQWLKLPAVNHIPKTIIFSQDLESLFRWEKYKNLFEKPDSEPL